jgi:hypothetical protein
MECALVTGFIEHLQIITTSIIIIIICGVGPSP